MKPVNDNYPVFEANQVLTNIHLNDIFSYLDEQERLTRANLIGIGIVCGLEIRHETTGDNVTIHVTKGCGITSEGYLIVEPTDVALVSYRRYMLPADLEYLPFKDLTLWEMFPAGELGTTSLNDSSDFLNDKVVVLFLELKKEDLRNCSPNNCDDKGAQVTATVRRLLIEKEALNKIIAKANQLGANLTFAELEAAMLARLNLPDLRLPRLGVPAAGLVTSSHVFAAFQSVFQAEKLAAQMKKALGAAYVAFRPLLETLYPEDPFSNFDAKFGFLDTMLQERVQVLFLQYYYDFFDDLIKAYDEFRWKGVELMCVCCPPEGLFPRHLMLGELYPETAASPGIYRHSFLASSGIGGCDERIKDLKLLFQRLVEMIIQFTDTPPIRPNALEALTDTQIRITPSQLGDVPLGNKAIPYYYQQNGSPPLYHLWNAEKHRRNRVNQNLSYRADEYQDPAAPPFTTDALRYDLEPYNFLRIEGHLGKDYRSVLDKLISLKTQYQLPIEIIALRTGVFDETIPVNLDKEKCRFQDLEALYDALREELRCFLAKELEFFYNLPIREVDDSDTAERPSVPVLRKYRTDFLVRSDRLGALFESQYKHQIFSDELLNFVSNITNTAFFRIIFRIVKLDETLSESLADIDFNNIARRYRDLEEAVRQLEAARKTYFDKLEDKANIILQAEEINDHLEAILFNCRLDAFQSIHTEYQRRLTEAKQKQFLSFFLQKNPGIQHKAGVPLGGTFIIVYHDNPEPIQNPNSSFNLGNLNLFGNLLIPNLGRFANNPVNPAAFEDALTRISANRTLADDPDIQLVLGNFIRQLPDLGIFIPLVDNEASNIINQTVNGLTDGMVIADFFLPYLCCSDCSPVQYVLPAPPPPNEPCDLPCGGQSRRCAYRLWIQPPIAGNELSYYQHKGGVIKFEFNGEPIGSTENNSMQVLSMNLDFSDQNGNLGDLNNNFNTVFNNAVEGLNSTINKELVAKGYGDKRLVITYENGRGYPFAILKIESFVCDAFKITFDFWLGRDDNLDTHQSIRVTYLKEKDSENNMGSSEVIFSRHEQTELTEVGRVPAFDFEEQNQCTGSKYRNLCEDPKPRPVIKLISVMDDISSLEGLVSNQSEADKVIAWVWDFVNIRSNDLFYVSDNPNGLSVHIIPGKSRIRLTVITKNGCFGIVDQQLFGKI